MKINELKDKEKVEEIDLKIIFNQAEPKEIFGKTIQTIIVADAESKQGDPTAFLDLVNGKIGMFQHLEKIKIKDAYSKKRNNGQFWITNVKSIEKIE